MPASPRERYLEQGYLLVEGLFDAEAIASALRAVADVPEWMRRVSRDRNVQRAQPLQSCPVVKDPLWIRRFYDNPELDRILDEIFGEDIEPSPRMSKDIQLTALMLAPLDRWWSTGLHRDYRDFFKDGFDLDGWKARTGDLRVFNQVNIALLPDECLWAVPGSHLREDTEAEAGMVAGRGRYAELAGASPDRVARCRAELADEMAACGAVNLRMEPGDFLLYRSNMLHCGVYEPGVDRMTIHDGVYSAEWHAYTLALYSNMPDIVSPPELRGPGAGAGR